MLIVTTGRWWWCYCRCRIFTCIIRIEKRNEMNLNMRWGESVWVMSCVRVRNAYVRFNLSSLGKLILTRSDKLILLFGMKRVRCSFITTIHSRPQAGERARTRANAPLKGNAENCTGILSLFAYNSDVCPIKNDARPHKRRDKYLRSISS